jgi:hypothetical protein
MMIFCGKDMDLCELKEKEIIYKQPEPIKLNETKSREEEFEEQNRKFKELFESNGKIIIKLKGEYQMNLVNNLLKIMD